MLRTDDCSIDEMEDSQNVDIVSWRVEGKRESCGKMSVSPLRILDWQEIKEVVDGVS